MNDDLFQAVTLNGKELNNLSVEQIKHLCFITSNQSKLAKPFPQSAETEKNRAAEPKNF